MVFANISAEKAMHLIEENKSNKNFAIIDVRTLQEYKGGHIKDAVLIDIYEKNFREKIKELNKRKTYLIYCRSGNRSFSAMKLMAELGFGDVYNLAGGLIDWNEMGFEIIN